MPLVVAALPLQVYESPSFKALVKFLQPAAADCFYGRTTLSRRILPAARVLRNKELREALSGQHFVLVADGWHQRGHARGFEGIVILWLQETAGGVEVCRRMVDLVAGGQYTQSADVLASMIKEALLTYDMPWAEVQERCLCLVSDTASDMRATAARLGVPSHACIDHIINLGFHEVEVSDWRPLAVWHGVCTVCGRHCDCHGRCTASVDSLWHCPPLPLRVTVRP